MSPRSHSMFETFHKVKVLSEYTTTVAMEEDTQRDMDYLSICLVRSLYT